MVDEFAWDGGLDALSELADWAAAGGEVCVGFGLLDLRLEPTRFLNREDIENEGRRRIEKARGGEVSFW